MAAENGVPRWVEVEFADIKRRIGDLEVKLDATRNQVARLMVLFSVVTIIAGAIVNAIIGVVLRNMVKP